MAQKTSLHKISYNNSQKVSSAEMYKFQYTDQNQSKFPIGSFILISLFYLIGIITYKSNSLSNFDSSYFSITILDSDIRTKFALVPEFKWQWQIFSYGLIHFALVHYAYVGVLIFYYIQGLEKATSAKFVIIGFFVLSSIWPVIAGILFFTLIDLFPWTNEWILSQRTYLGSSVGVWGLIGLSAANGRKRLLFWFGIVLLLVVEFALKIMANQDVTSNVTHILIFLSTWFYASKWLRIENNDLKIGVLNNRNKSDLLLIFLIIVHASGMIFYFLNQLEIT